MGKCRALFWLLAAPAALMAIAGAFVASRPPDPFASFAAEPLERFSLGWGRETVRRNVHADTFRLARLEAFRDYVASSNREHDALILRSRNPAAAIPTVTLRPGRVHALTGAFFKPPRFDGDEEWTEVSIERRIGIVPSALDWIESGRKKTKKAPLTFVRASYPRRVAISAYLARHNFR